MRRRFQVTFFGVNHQAFDCTNISSSSFVSRQATFESFVPAKSMHKADTFWKFNIRENIRNIGKTSSLYFQQHRPTLAFRLYPYFLRR